MFLSPGTRLGLYEVTAMIGEGGMGEILLCPRHQARPGRGAQGAGRLCAEGNFVRSAALGCPSGPGETEVQDVRGSGPTLSRLTTYIIYLGSLTRSEPSSIIVNYLIGG